MNKLRFDVIAYIIRWVHNQTLEAALAPTTKTGWMLVPFTRFG